MDFDEFARSFRERTAQRMLEFEKTLSKAQDDLEKSAREAREAQGQATAARYGSGESDRYGAPGSNDPGSSAPGSFGSQGYTAASYRYGSGYTSAPTRHATSGQVRSVLRRDG